MLQLLISLRLRSTRDVVCFINFTGFKVKVKSSYHSTSYLRLVMSHQCVILTMKELKMSLCEVLLFIISMLMSQNTTKVCSVL